MELRKLEDDDYDILMTLLYREPAQNIEIIGLAKVYGISKGMAVFYGVFESRELKACIANIVPSTLYYYSQGISSVEMIAEFISKLKWKAFCGKKEDVEPFISQIDYKKIVNRYLAETNDYEMFDIDDSSTYTLTNEEELGELLDMYGGIDEFKEFMTIGREKVMRMQMRMFMTPGNGLKVYVREDVKMVSVAGAAMENDMFALLAGVGTDSEFRKMGYATMACKKLMNEYKRKNKKLCLFYTNPKAGSIYRKLGFIETATGLQILR